MSKTTKQSHIFTIIRKKGNILTLVNNLDKSTMEYDISVMRHPHKYKKGDIVVHYDGKFIRKHTPRNTVQQVENAASLHKANCSQNFLAKLLCR